MYVGDEYYLLAERPFPAAEAYEDFAMHEDGVGMARTLERELFGEKADATGKQDGFFAWADASGSADADYEPYRGQPGHRRPAAPGPTVPAARRSASSPAPTALACWSRCSDASTATTCGWSRSTTSSSAAPRRVTGLLVGEDLARTLAAQPEGHRYLLPDVCLSNGRFLDGTGPEDLPRPVEIIPTDGHALPRRARRRRMSQPTVAIVGRPNVGKSTLVNRIVGQRVAIVEEKPGVTRDRKLVDADWQGVPFTLVDTGGWIPKGSSLDDKVSRQSEQAIREADVVLVVVDAVTGVTEEDSRVADGRARAGPRSRAARGQQGRRRRPRGAHLGDAVARPRRSARDQRAARPRRRRRARPARGGAARRPTGRASTARTSSTTATARPTRTTSASSRSRWSGGPTSGKSTLFNRLIGEDRAVVHDLPGTTRDTVDTVVETDEGPIRFVDTAGMRRKAKIDEATEYYSLVRALQAVDHSDVALLVIDSTVGVTAQDQRLAERIDAAGSPVVVLLNKHELLADAEARADLDYQVRERLRFIGEAPGAQDLRAVGQGRAQAHARAVDEHRGLPPAGAHRAGERGAARAPSRRSPARTASGCSTAPRPPPTRPPSRCSPTARCRRPTCATSSAASGRPSTSAPPRSRCGSAAAADRASSCLT